MKRDLGNTRSPTPLVSNEDTEAQEFHLAQGEFTAQGHNRKLCRCSLSRTCFVPGLVLGAASTLSFTLGNNLHERDPITHYIDR